ncbi:TetR/AcrR family transcriptional regulator [Natronococcus jeotgali]|uniref:TetR family transcriptional regulator n=1 Tax=Natronococcus jeotgali DSM 18795 TaxID=1227498 RepID=L9WN19_9EURY|nr:TetR/AcrR family transcriptional regulator [Natronococcus jeotgali]ELY50875.1 TetR family transcriptional regulator [Natronococcus jeotgali DSM 18795]
MDDPEQAILEATYRALCEHGYAELTVQRIADESDLSKATIHYHYDSKNRLFMRFLEYLYERYSDRLDDVSGGTARDRLDALLTMELTDAETDPDINFQTAMLEVRAQAPYDEDIREMLNAFDEALVSRLRETIADGVDAGEFDDGVEPGMAADHLATTIRGAHTRHVAVRHPLDRSYETARTYVETYLVDGSAPEVTA